MPISSVSDAYAQYVASLPWEASVANATAALEALEYIYLHRAQLTSGDAISVSYERVETELAAIRRFLGYDARTARGSSWRRVR